MLENPQQHLRQNIRHQRRELELQQQQQSAQACLQNILQRKILKKNQSVAVYLQNDGELCTQPLIDYCWQNNIDVSLPILDDNNRGFLKFIQYTKDSIMVNNRFNIAEPLFKAEQMLPINSLNIIFMPLVAFDNKGSRLGMGGGFYDRTLGAIELNVCLPLKIGLAHSFQQVDALISNPWDQKMDHIVTPTEWISVN